MTHDDGDTREALRRERRRSRTGVRGVAMFVGGPVVGTAVAVVGVVLATQEDPRWVLLVVAGIAIGFGVTTAGMRTLFALEDARAADEAAARRGDSSREAAPGDAADPGGGIAGDPEAAHPETGQDGRADA